MRRGRKICDTLKEIRQRIADANDIEYAPAECHHEGECAGTCPKCESEMRYLENELSRRHAMGRAVMVTGLGMGLAALSACGKSVSPQKIQPINNGGTTTISEDVDGYISRRMTTIDVSVERDTAITSQAVPAANVCENEEKDSHIYGYIEPSPTYPGGSMALRKFLSEHLVYPEEAAKEGVEGKVYVKFSISPDGTLHGHQIVRSVDSRLDEEALRVTKLLEKFNPAPGQKHDVWYTVPLEFKLPPKAEGDKK